MPSRWPLLAGIAGLLAAAALAAAAQPASAAGAEEITSYTVGVTILRDGAAHVRETIVYDFGRNLRHGIFRQIPYLVPAGGFHNREYLISAMTAETPPGTPAPAVVSRSGGEVSMRIGNPGQRVTGTHTYVISYDVRRAVTAEDGRPLFSWNLVGDAWPVPILRVVAQIRAPAAITSVSCVSGFPGSRAPCAQSARSGSAAAFRARALQPGEGMTATVGMPAGSVRAAPPLIVLESARLRSFEPAPLPLGLSAAALALAWAWPALSAWWWRRRLSPPRHRGGVAAGLAPGQAGLLAVGHATAGHLAATVFDLAVRGHLRIGDAGPAKGKAARAGERDWVLSRLAMPGSGEHPPDSSPLLPYERTVLHGLFRDGSQVRMRELKDSFGPVMARAGRQLTHDAISRGWLRPRHGTRLPWTVCGAGAAVLLAGLLPGTPPRGPALAGLILLLGGSALVMLARVARSRAATRTPEGDRLRRQMQSLRKELRSRQPAAEDPWAVFSEDLPFAVAFGITGEWAAPYRRVRAPAPELGWWAPAGAPNATFVSCVVALASTIVTVAPPARLLRGDSGLAVQAPAFWQYGPGGLGGSGLGGGSFGGGVGDGGGGGGGGSW